MAVPAYEASTCFLAQTATVRSKPPTVVVPGLKGGSPLRDRCYPRCSNGSGVWSGIDGKEDQEASHRRVCGLGERKEGRKEGSAGLARHETIYGRWKQCCRRPTKGATTLLCRPVSAEPPAAATELARLPTLHRSCPGRVTRASAR